MLMSKVSFICGLSSQLTNWLGNLNKNEYYNLDHYKFKEYYLTSLNKIKY